MNSCDGGISAFDRRSAGISPARGQEGRLAHPQGNDPQITAYVFAFVFVLALFLWPRTDKTLSGLSYDHRSNPLEVMSEAG